MFRDPSGLAPEGEKNSKVQGPGYDYISGGYTSGYWTTETIFVTTDTWIQLDNPIGFGKMKNRTHTEAIVFDIFVSGNSGAGGGGDGGSNFQASTRTGSQRSKPRKFRNRNYVEKSMVDQENNENGLYVTYDSRYQMMISKHSAEITIGAAGPLNLFKATGVIDLTPDDPSNDVFIDYLRALIHNNKEPVALSGDQQYNKSFNEDGEKNWNVHTPNNSDYGMRTAFYDASKIHRYLSINGAENHNVGNIIAHEFFGHLIQAMFGMRITSEVSAMGVENLFNFLYDFPQRKSYDYFKRNYALPPYAPIFQ